MKHVLYIVLAVFAAMSLFVSCGPDIVISATAIANAYVTNVNSSEPLLPDTGSAMIPKDADSPQVTMCGYVLNTATKQPVSGVIVRIVGTDTPGGNTITNGDGSWTLPLPIVPDRNDENVTLFAIELQKSGAVTDPISSYCKDSVVWKLLRVENPNTYMVAGVYFKSLLWSDLYAKIENHLYITMQ